MRDSKTTKDERYRVLFESCYSKVVDYARRRVPAHEVDDVVSATFLVVWRRWDDVPAGSGALRWVYGVARRVVSERHRSRARWYRLGTRLAGMGQTTEPTLDAIPDDAVAAALARMRSGDRAVLLLAYWEDLAPDEIAGILGSSINAARIRLHRARKRFAEIWASIEDDDQSASFRGRGL